ncbi:metal ABC transporter permease [Corynebacterium sp. CCM 9185]|uniref:metal ABC transporter permease n=1 Tax=Corynebacterium marambiense TaxID=2765364 RepID=UPI001E3D5234|nr:metal ABC transporter permease [Corynebacterium marambiense]MCK7662227.1 metal ABC transporter permease [Corynebacterium marambiense]MCX7541496.1 metal ABC transporter permease [Corynebacterium marambiense]
MSFFDSTLWTILQLPILEIVVVGVLAGLVGVLAVLNQRVFFVESVAHGTFPGAILGVVLGKGLAADWNLDNDTQHAVLSLFLFAGALLACVPLSWLMHRLTRIAGQSSQASAGIVLTLGFALGYFLSKWFQPLPLKIESFLTGSVLSVNRTDVLAAAVVLVITLIILAIFGRQLIFYAFDGSGYRAAGHSATIAEGIILGLICAAIVVVIPAVGTILSIALIAAPAAGLQPLVRSTLGLFIAAPIAGIAIGAVGLAFAVKADLSAGGMIALTAGVFYIGCLAVGRLLAGRR